SAAKAIEQLGCRAAPTIRVLAEEAGEPLRVELLGALWRRVALAEGQGNRRVDVGEDRDCPWPEAIEQRSELIRELNARGDKIVTSAHQSTKCLRLVGWLAQGRESVPIRANQVREQIGVAGVALRERCPVPGPSGLDRIRV